MAFAKLSSPAIPRNLEAEMTPVDEILLDQLPISLYGGG